MNKSDIEGASPLHFKHRPRKYFVDRQEIKSTLTNYINLAIFNQKVGNYHGFLNDKIVGGTYVGDRPEAVFKWSMNSKKDLQNRVSLRDENKLL